MPEILTPQQRQYLVAAALILSWIAALAVPADLPYKSEVQYALVGAGLLSVVIQKFLAMSPDEQAAIMSVIQQFAQMSPEEQKRFLALVPQLQAMLTALQTPVAAPKPAPPPAPTAASPPG
jgi:hypothetical protein